MRVAKVLLGIVAVAIGALPGAADSPRDLVISAGTDGRLASSVSPGRRRAPWIEVAATDESFVELWGEYVPGEPDDADRKVDFSGELAVFLLLGPQQTGGYAIEPISVKTENGVVRVRAKLVQPMSPDDVKTQMITAPYAVVAVPGRGTDTIEWIDADGRLLATRVLE